MERHEREWLRSQMAELADGNREAFDGVYARVWPLVRGFVMRHLPPAEAEDVAQDALLRVFSRASEFERDRDALAWILGICAWEIRTARQRRRRRREDPLDDAAVAGRRTGEPTPEEEAMSRDRNAMVDEALAGLAPSDRETLQAYMHGAHPGIPPATFRKRVQRALERARSAWKPRGERELR